MTMHDSTRVDGAEGEQPDAEVASVSPRRGVLGLDRRTWTVLAVVVVFLAAIGLYLAVNRPAQSQGHGGVVSSLAERRDAAFTRSERVLQEYVDFRKQPASTLIPKDADWATAGYITESNSVITAWEAKGYTLKGSSQVVSTKRAHYTESPLQTSFYICGQGDIRLINPDGVDVTADQQGNRIPTGVRRTRGLVVLTTADGGRTWKVDDVRPLGGTC